MEDIIVPVFALSIPIVAILGGLIVKPWFALQHRKLELNASIVAEKAAQYAAHTERLEQRVRVLERIATDRGSDMASEIDRLADSPKLN